MRDALVGRHVPNGDFTEVAHRAREGHVVVGIMKACAGDENTARRPRPGYGLHDPALGIQYLLGVWGAAGYR